MVNTCDMSSSKTKNRLTIHNTVRIPREQPPTRGKAIPSYAGVEDVKLKMPSALSVPQWNTVLRQKKEIDKIESLKPRRYTTTGNLTPRTKTAIMPKINQRLNFDVSRPVFKNLTPINVNDSLLLPREKTSIRNKYNKPSKSTKPPAPDLADFLDPIKPLTHVIPLPEITIEFPKYKENPMEIYQRFIDNSFLEHSSRHTGIN